MKRDLTEKDYQNIAEWMYQGKSIKQVARLLKISRSYLYELMEKDVQLSDTISFGKENAEGWWEEEGQNNLGNKNFNYQGWYMNMKNRFGWADKSEQKVQAEVTVSPESLDVQRIRNEYKKEI